MTNNVMTNNVWTNVWNNVRANVGDIVQVNVWNNVANVWIDIGDIDNRTTTNVQVIAP